MRIISSCSLVDQIVERLLHRIQNMNEIEVWPDCPSKPGLGLHDEGMQILARNIKDLLQVNGKVVCNDMSAWDWTVQEWELRADMEARIQLARASDDSLYAFLCRVNAFCVARSVFVDSDGYMWAQDKVYGGQLSGRYCTSSSNSRMRVLASLVARQLSGYPTLVKRPDGKESIGMMSMGDDTVEVHLPGIDEGLNELGHICREFSVHEELAGVDFCSQVWRSDGFAGPTKPAKTVYRFLSRKHSTPGYVDLWSQLCWYLRHTGGDDLSIIRSLGEARVERATKIQISKPSTNGEKQESP